MEDEMHDDRSEIQGYFEGRSVLVTGAGGFLGGVLLEHLLRLCPGISEIFILLREKKGCSPEKRKDNILDKPIFWKVKQENLKALEKVHVVPGELTEDDLGISTDDFEKLSANVSVVIHTAAIVSFRKPFRDLVLNNVVGTHNVVKLCRKLPKLEAFVHTSTAYSNYWDTVIREEITVMPFSVNRVIEAASDGNEKFLATMKKTYGKKWGKNDYVFTKSIAENVVYEATDIPRIIVRPSIINNIWKGSLPGYMETGTLFADVACGIATGFTQVVLVDSSKLLDTIPSDIVANTLITAAWGIATQRIPSPQVLNCISSNSTQLKWQDVIDQIVSKPLNCIGPYSIRNPGVIAITNSTLYRLLSFLLQHLPGYAIDLYSRLNGGKQRLVKVYKVIDQGLLDVKYFLAREFIFQSQNFDDLTHLFNKKDKKLFSVDLSSYSFEHLVLDFSVNKNFRFKNDDITLKLKQVARRERATLINEIYKYTLMFLLLVFSWFVLKLLFSIFI